MQRPDPKKHLASSGHIGRSGRRCGTTLYFDPWEALYRQNAPWFRYRNDECEAYCLEIQKTEHILPPGALCRPIRGHFRGRGMTVPVLAEWPSECPMLSREKKKRPLQANRVELHQSGPVYQLWCKSGLYWSTFGQTFLLTKLGREVVYGGHP